MRLRFQRRILPGSVRKALHESTDEPIRLSVEPVEWSWSWPKTIEDVYNDPGEELDEIADVAAGQGGSVLAFVGANGGVCIAVANRFSEKDGEEDMKVTALPCGGEGAAKPRARAVEIVEFGTDIMVIVGYSDGNLRIYDLDGVKKGITKPTGLEVASLKFVPSFVFEGNILETSERLENSGLFAIFGTEGLVGKLTIKALRQISIRSTEFGYVPDGKGWVLWHLPHKHLMDAVPAGGEPPAITDESSDGSIRVLSAGVSPTILATSCSGESSLSASTVAMQAVGAIFGAAKGLIYSKRGSEVSRAENPREQPVAGIANISVQWNDELTKQTSSEQDQRSSHSFTGFDVRGNARRSVKAASSLIRSRVTGSSKSVEESDTTTDSQEHAPMKRPRTSVAGMANTNATPLAGSAVENGESNGIRGILSSPQEQSVNDIRDTQPGSYSRSTLRLRSLSNLFPKNRIITSVATPPQPSTLFALADNIGRVALHDNRDLCLVRLYKGHRDARLAWVNAYSETLLAIFSPPTSSLSLYNPLKDLRAQHKPLFFFQVPSKSLMLTAVTNYQLILIDPHGHIFVLRHEKKVDNDDSLQIAEESNSEHHERFFKTSNDFVEHCRQAKIKDACELLSHRTLNECAYLLSQLLLRDDVDVSAECHCAVAQFVSSRASFPIRCRFDAHFRIATAAGLLLREARKEREPISSGRVINPLIADLSPFLERDGTHEYAPQTHARLLNVSHFIRSHNLCLKRDIERDGNPRIMPDVTCSQELLKMYFELSSGLDESINVILIGTLGYSQDEVAAAFGKYLLEAPLGKLVDAVEDGSVCKYLIRWSQNDMQEIVAFSTRVVHGLIIVRVTLNHLQSRLQADGYSKFELFDLMDRLDACVRCHSILTSYSLRNKIHFSLTAQSVTPGPLAGEAVAVYVLITGGHLELAMKTLLSCTAASDNFYHLRQVGEHAVDGSRFIVQQVLQNFLNTISISAEVKEWITSGPGRYGVQKLTTPITREYVRNLEESLGGVLRVAMSCLEDASVESVRCLQLAGVTAELSSAAVPDGDSITELT